MTYSEGLHRARVNEKVHYTFDDFLLKPKHVDLSSRSDVDTSVTLTEGISIDFPVIPANMTTVTNVEVAREMHQHGGLAILPRQIEENQKDAIEFQKEQLEKLRSQVTVGASVGIKGDVEFAVNEYEDAGASLICVDVAHGHLQKALDTISAVNETTNLPIIGGNVASGEAVKDLYQAGADIIKVGIGPGSACKTRTVTGSGVPQVSAIVECIDAAYEIEEGRPSIIADGGMNNSGDVMKALMAGADAAMMGSYFAGCPETPGKTVEQNGKKFKQYNGMASNKERNKNSETGAEEGEDTLVPLDDSIAEIISELKKGIQSGCSYCGGDSLEMARENAELIRVSQNCTKRNGIHDVLNVD